MKVYLLVGVASMGCSMIQSTPRTTTPSSNGATPPPSAEYSGPDAYWVPDLMNKTRSDAEQLLHDQHFQGQVIATGDTDPQYARDELVCEQAPKFGKIAPTATITLKYCNTYKKPDDGPTLVGLSVEAAKQKAVAAGFTGKIEVTELSGFDASCKEGTVCRVEPVRWYLDQDRTMQLLVNEKVK